MRRERAIIYAINDHSTTRTEMMRWAASCGLEGRPFLSGPDFLEELPYLSPGIVVVELERAGMNGFELIEITARARYDCPVVTVLAEYNVAAAVACLRRGAVDVVVRADFPEARHEAIVKARGVLELRRPLAEQFVRDDTALRRLNAREREVLKALPVGLTSKAIAEQLSLSVRTLESYRASLVNKLECGTSASAIAMVVRHDTFQKARASFGAVTGVQLSQAT